MYRFLYQSTYFFFPQFQGKSFSQLFSSSKILSCTCALCNEEVKTNLIIHNSCNDYNVYRARHLIGNSFVMLHAWLKCIKAFRYRVHTLIIYGVKAVKFFVTVKTYFLFYFLLVGIYNVRQIHMHLISFFIKNLCHKFRKYLLIKSKQKEIYCHHYKKNKKII